MKRFLVAVGVMLLASQGAMAQVCGPGCCPCNQPVGDFNAYELKVPIDASVMLTTMFGASNFHVNRARRLHTPTAPAPLNGLHWLGYEVDSGTPFAPGNVTLNTALGQVTGDANKVKWVVIPANKSLSPPAPAAPADVNAFVCFGGQLKGPKADVANTDQFGSQVMSLHKVDSVCAPATLDGSAPGATWRVCFDAKPNPKIDPPAVWVTSIIQMINGYDLEPVDEFCVPGTL